MNKSDAIAHFGTQSEIGEVLGISQAAVSKWPDLIPEKQALKLSILTKGALVYDAAAYKTTESKLDAGTVSQQNAA